MSYTDELELFNVLSSQLSNQLSKKYLSKKHNDKDVVIDSTFDAGAYISSILNVLNGVNKPEESNEEDFKFYEDDCKCDDTCCDDVCNKEEERQFKDISTEVKYKNKTITVSDATLQTKKVFNDIFGDENENENRDTEFIAYLGENSKVVIIIDNPDYDEDLSHVGNAKKLVTDYLKDNPTVVTVLNEVDDKDVRSYSAEVDSAEEAVDIISTVNKNTFVNAVVSFPADKTFEVVSQVANLKPSVSFDVYPTGDRNVLVTFSSFI